MNRDQQLELIRRKCIEANPEIEELKFGCGLYVETLGGYGGHDIINQHRRVTAEQCRTEGLPPYLVGAYFGERGYIQPDFRMIAGLRDATVPNVFRVVEVIDRPLRLADVLLAALTKWRNTPDLKEEPRMWLEFVAALCNGSSEFVPQAWNLRKDDLAEQSDECLAFLANLLE